MPIPPQGEPPPQGESPANGSPKKRKRVRSSGSLEKVKVKLWQAVITAEEIAMDPELDPATTIRAVHAMVQAAAAYVRVSQPAELEERLKSLEEDEFSSL